MGVDDDIFNTALDDNHGGNDKLTTTGGGPAPHPVQILIPRTEERSSMGGLKSYTAYCIQVCDFGRTHTVERRFDDFQKLHADLIPVDGSLPSLPEKKMFASTDASVVAERRPAFENLLNHMLKSEAIVFETNQYLWQFVELPNQAVTVARYLFRNHRVPFIRQVSQLMEPVVEQDHGFRLCHDAMVDVNLQLLNTEGAFANVKATSGGNGGSGGGYSQAGAAAELVPVEGDPSTKQTVDEGEKAPQSEAELEGSVINILNYSVRHATCGEGARKRFLQQRGVKTMLELLLRISRREGATPTPNQRARNVLNALVSAEGERFPAIFADFLRQGGVAVLSGFKELCVQHAPFAEFLGKLLWLVWDADTQAAFLQGDTTGSTALSLLSALFSSGTKSARIMAGLLLSSLIANNSFLQDRDREAMAAGGINGLVEDLLSSLPSTSAAKKPGDAGVIGGGDTSEDVQAAEAFMGSVGRNERSFARLIACLCSPCDIQTGEVIVGEGSATWSACAFALWCMVKVQPKPARLAKVRPLLPILALSGPSRVRWLAGELLLSVHMVGDGDGATAASAVAGSPPAEQQEAVSASSIGKEQHAMEVTMAEQINHMLGVLQDGLQENRNVMKQQQELAATRDTPMVISAGSGGTGWSAELDGALQKLANVREKLNKGTASLRERESRSAQSLEGLHKSLERSGGGPSESDIANALSSAHEIEQQHAAKKADWAQLDADFTEQSDKVERCNQNMEEAERKVAAMRKTITDMEMELSSKQREAQYQRTLASSDRGFAQSQLNSDIEQIDKRISGLREKAAKLQAPPEAGQASLDPAKIQETMTQLKAEAQKCKQQRMDKQAELAKVSADPKELEQSAQRSERQAAELQEQLTTLRSTELLGLERAHFSHRETWQQQTTALQDIRWRRDSVERDTSEVKRQLDERWRLWQPLWSARLRSWHARASALSEAQVAGGMFSGSVNKNWELLQEEQEARQAVIQAVVRLQENLSHLAQQMAAIGDMR